MFIDLLSKVLVGNTDDNVDKLLKARFIHESDDNYPKHILHIFAENEPTMKTNDNVLNDLPAEIYTTKAYSNS